MGSCFSRMRVGDETVTFTGADRLVKVYRFTTTPTDSSEPLFRVDLLTAKEAAIEEIMAQPFYAPNAIAQGREPHSGEASPGATG